MADNLRRVSVGIPVYNGEKTLPRALNTLLAQTFKDFEVVISDNASEDGTRELCLEYARRDGRIRYDRNDVNIGQIGNFNRVFELSGGEYFRWAGCNDWWEPEYLERCVEELDNNPSAVMVTCYQAHYDDAGNRYYEEYTGPRVDSELAYRRYSRMLWFLRASRYYIDPIYSLIRRSALLQTPRLRMMVGTDLVLSADLSLLGPICHVPECLAYRMIEHDVTVPDYTHRFGLSRRSARGWLIRMSLAMGSTLMCRPLPSLHKALCLLSLVRFFVIRQFRQFRSAVALRTRYRALMREVRARIGWDRLPAEHDTGTSNRAL